MTTRRIRQEADLSNGRRQEIRALATEMFFDRGFESTTMRQIAAAMKIKSASLYYYFPNKEQILFDVVVSVVRELIDGAKALVSSEDQHQLKLAALVVNHVVLHALRPKATTLGDTELRSFTGQRRKANIELRDEYERIVLNVLAQGAKHAGFDLIDPKLTAYALIAQSSNVGIWYHEHGRLDLDSVASVHVDLALRAVAADSVGESEVQRLVEAASDFHSRFAQP